MLLTALDWSKLESKLAFRLECYFLLIALPLEGCEGRGFLRRIY